jgi:hypothetical protein
VLSPLPIGEGGRGYREGKAGYGHEVGVGGPGANVRSRHAAEDRTAVLSVPGTVVRQQLSGSIVVCRVLQNREFARLPPEWFRHHQGLLHADVPRKESEETNQIHLPDTNHAALQNRSGQQHVKHTLHTGTNKNWGTKELYFGLCSQRPLRTTCQSDHAGMQFNARRCIHQPVCWCPHSCQHHRLNRLRRGTTGLRNQSSSGQSRQTAGRPCQRYCCSSSRGR